MLRTLIYGSALIGSLLLAGSCFGQTTFTCSSNDGRRHYCGADTRGGVMLTRQISGSPCQQGSTWGFDRGGVWVDRGCRAEFQTTRYRPVQNLTCSSDDGRRRYCGADTQGGVRMIRQRSGSPCQQGSTWGYDRRGVWVDRGCRADFEIGGGGGGFRPPVGGGQTFRCSSDDGRRHYCDADTRDGIRMVRQVSGSPCQQGSTWGYDRRGVWVDRGCRADFQTGR
ncbi:MAG: DUF3011 domain-containing protein [Bryobacteraceae bacterium]